MTGGITREGGIGEALVSSEASITQCTTAHRREFVTVLDAMSKELLTSGDRFCLLLVERLSIKRLE